MITINPDNPQPRLIQKAATILHQGGIIAYPTDTIYGIGCNVFNKKAIERIYQIKQKSRKEPLSFICPDLKNVSKFAILSNPDYKIMRRLFPGPYTFVLKGTRVVPKLMLTKRKTVGIRVPNNNICLMLLNVFGNPIVSTSVSVGDNGFFNDPYDIEDRLGRALDLIIDGGVLGFESSSVIDLTNQPPSILRRGKGDVSFFE